MFVLINAGESTSVKVNFFKTVENQYQISIPKTNHKVTISSDEFFDLFPEMTSNVANGSIEILDVEAEYLFPTFLSEVLKA
jgi:hypothetical protein